MFNKKMSYIKKEIKKGFKEFKNGTKTMFKEFFNKETNKKQRANMWTFLRLIIPVLTLICSIVAISLSSTLIFGATAGLVGFGALTDYLDGKSARKHESSSKYGKLLDQISDKVFAGIIGINLLLINPNYLAILLGEILIASINVGFKLKYNDLDIISTKIGKIKEWPLFLSLALGFLSPINSTLLTISNSSIALTLLFQFLTAKSYVINNNKEIEKLKINNNAKIELEIENNEDKVKEKELVLKKENKNTREKIEELKTFKNSLVENNEINIDEINLGKPQKINTLN